MKLQLKKQQLSFYIGGATKSTQIASLVMEINSENIKPGRPTEYKKEYIAKASEYLEICQDNQADNKLKVKLPTIEGFARFIGVNKTSLYEWEKKDEEFSNALDNIRQEQQQRLINSGLSGEYNSTIAKLILSSNHGMSEKMQQEHTNPDGNLKTIIINKSNAIDNKPTS